MPLDGRVGDHALHEPVPEAESGPNLIIRSSRLEADLRGRSAVGSLVFRTRRLAAEADDLPVRANEGDHNGRTYGSGTIHAGARQPGASRPGWRSGALRYRPE